MDAAALIMSADGSIRLAWIGGEHTFRLAIGQLRILQEKCGAGPLAIHDRLRGRVWFIDDIRETIRLGLIGEGMAAEDAERLVKVAVDAQPLMTNVPVARTILGAALIGVPDDPVGKHDAEGDQKGTDQTGSPSPRSTAPAPPSDCPPARSTRARSGNLLPASTDGTEPTAPTTSRDRRPKPSSKK